MGLSTNVALANMLERCETPSMRSFVRSIVQGETLGVSMGTIMRNLAAETRKRRRQHAEERAHKAPGEDAVPARPPDVPVDVHRAPLSRRAEVLAGAWGLTPWAGTWSPSSSASWRRRWRSQAVGAIGDAADEARLESWLIAGYQVLKFAVAVAFTVFVIIRGPSAASCAEAGGVPHCAPPSSCQRCSGRRARPPRRPW